MRFINSLAAFVAEWIKPMPEPKVYTEPCFNCGKKCDFNYCNWDCLVECAKKENGTVITPNGLPIKCVKADGTALEHDHADHPDYKFPVEVEYVGHRPSKEEHERDWIDFDYCDQEHALIYTDGTIALTLFEYCYAMFSLNSGRAIGGKLWDHDNWQLTNESLQAIKESVKKL